MSYELPPNLPCCAFEPRSAIAWQKSGLNPRFIKAILDVATAYNIIILIRANDPNYIGLLDDQYTTKSMFVHSKTCSWGPMTGIVLADPRFHKKCTKDRRQRMFQIHSLIESLSHPNPEHRLKKFCALKITERRRAELVAKGIIHIVNESPDHQIVSALEPRGEAVPETHHFQLRRTQSSLGSEQLWAVQYINQSHGLTAEDILSECSRAIIPEPTDKYLAFRDGIHSFYKWLEKNKFGNCDILSVVDPNCPYPENDYRSATTGDYDLFALHPLLVHYAAQISLLSDVLSQSLISPITAIPGWIQKPSSIKLYEELLPARRATERRMSRTRLVKDDVPLSKIHQDVVGIARSPSGVLAVASSDHTPHATGSPSGSPGSSPGTSPNPSPGSSPGSPPLQGALSQRELNLIADLNHRIAYSQSHALRLFHHGPDSHNPHGEKPDLPCIALIPCATHSSAEGAFCFRGVYIDNERKLADFYFWNVICAGYALTPGINLKWFDIENPTLLNVWNPLTEIHRQIQMPYKRILHDHIKFEQYLSAHHSSLPRISVELWRDS